MKIPDSFAILDSMEENFRDCGINCPLFIAELQAGWFDKWGGTGYKNISKQISGKNI